VLKHFKGLMLQVPNATVIWHARRAAVDRPTSERSSGCSAPAVKHLLIDLSWRKTAKYITASTRRSLRPRAH
jgi:hypothetical protein